MAHLLDIFYLKFKHSPRTFMWGEKRLDYILVDPSLIPALERIGYLGTHEGLDSDHVYAFMDITDRIAHQGLVHRPITTKSKEFNLTQSDKVNSFLDGLIKSSKMTRTRREKINSRERFYTMGLPQITGGNTSRYTTHSSNWRAHTHPRWHGANLDMNGPRSSPKREQCYYYTNTS
jgi:hypothetical protein